MGPTTLVPPRSPSGRLCLKLGLLALVPLLVLLDAGVALLRGWEVTSRLDLGLLAVALAAVGAFGLAFGSKRGRAMLVGSGEQLAYVGFSLVGAWLVAEAVVAGVTWYVPELRPAVEVAAGYHRRPANLQRVFHPEALPGIEGESRYTTNSLGIRGPESPPRAAAYRILFVGGSTTECIYLDDEEVWTHLVMQRLNDEPRRRRVWTGSVGISGYPTVNHLRFVKTSPLVNEVDSIVLLIGANDFNQYLRGNLVGDDFNQGQEDDGDVSPLWHASPIVGLVRRLWGWRASILTEDERARNIAARAALRRQGLIRDALPRTLLPIEEALALYEARVRSIVELTRSRGVRVVFITQPTLWGAGLSEAARARLWMGDISVERGEYLSAGAGRKGIDRHNEILLKVCRDLRAECISTEAMSGREDYFYDDFHYTEAGARALAQLVSEHFLSRASSHRWTTAR